MSSADPTRALVGEDVVLDARLALYHRAEKWLAVADVHFGYELSQRAAGGLFPLWGMDSIERRLLTLLADYQPERLIIAGDFVHDRASRPQALELLTKLRGACEVSLVAGNHDRRAFDAGELCECCETPRFLFHHGDAPAPVEAAGRTVIIGHHHPAVTLRDGAGLALKLPALVQTPDRWILPAFSPWAAGGGGRFGRDAKLWLCSPKRILPPKER
jgi:putative SbcD/Mre11-related phosphoesterase